MDRVSIYVHVPFCVQKCRYCDFYSIEGGDNDLIERCISNILDQIVYYYALLGRPEVTSLYVGGGTPSSIGSKSAMRLLNGLNSALPLQQTHEREFEFTVEVNPESLTAELLNLYTEYGVNRLSVGVQTFSPLLSERIGRTGSPALSIAALDLVCSHWQGSFNLDLITAIPGQSVEEGLADVRSALSYSPDHLSLYTLTIEPHTPLFQDLAQGLIPSPRDAEVEVWKKQLRLLEDSGYERYEISNYALPGCRSRHNMTYWQMLPYLGCGPSAVSTLPSENGPIRIENPRQMGAKSGESYEVLAPEAFFLEHIMVGLRLTEGIELRRLESLFGVDPLVPLKKTVAKWNSFVEIDKDRLRMTSAGRDFLDGFLTDGAAEIAGYDFPQPIWP